MPPDRTDARAILAAASTGLQGLPSLQEDGDRADVLEGRDACCPPAPAPASLLCYQYSRRRIVRLRRLSFSPLMRLCSDRSKTPCSRVRAERLSDMLRMDLNARPRRWKPAESGDRWSAALCLGERPWHQISRHCRLKISPSIAVDEAH